jgi:glycogen synthase
LSTIGRADISRCLKSPAPLRIALLTGDFYPEQIGGQGIYAFEVATRAAALGLEMMVVCPATAARIAHRYPGRVRVRLVEAAANPLAFAAALTPIQRQVVASADVLHVNELFGFTASMLRPRRTGLVISSHNSYLDRFHAASGPRKFMYLPLIALERLSYPRADCLIIGSEIEREPARQLGVADSKIRTVPYGVDASRFSDPTGSVRAKTRARLRIPETARVALFVGRLVTRKKPQVVARAFLRLAAADPNFHGLLIGDGDMMEPVRGIVAGEPRIQLLGAIPFEQLPEYYAAADAFTLPSVGEGSISLVVLEAAAAGLPLVLTADSSGQSAIFEPGRNGELVKLDDAVDLAAGLSRALDSKALFGERSRQLVAEHFSWDACARQTVACYEDALRFSARS